MPEDFEAGLFELWAVNLLVAALTPLDSEAKSFFNCAVFLLNLEDGLLEQDAIFVDTTKMQVQGEGHLKFKTGELSWLLIPRAKKPEYFSLATPITVSGTISDYRIGIRPGGLIATATRFIFSPIHVTFRRLFQDENPANTRFVCADAMERPK